MQKETKSRICQSIPLALKGISLELHHLKQIIELIPNKQNIHYIVCNLLFLINDPNSDGIS